MSDLSQLTPQPLWDIFANICAIPHPSYHEEALATHILQWAQGKGLFAERDQVGNILIRKPATPGYENRRPVAMQAHLDMVPQKNSDTIHDFTQDPIQPWIDGEWVKARGTTLGADNGIGMASALAVLADDSVEHGPLEVLLTMTEETGMEGAFGLQPGWLQSEILINTDSEEEGEIYMGCAGGVDFKTQLPLSRETAPAGYHKVRVALTGLRGGHSGGDIHLGLGNANKLLARFLADFCATLDIRLLDINGGTLRNAIPREAFAILALPREDVDTLRTQARAYLAMIESELAAVEKKPVLEVSDSQHDGQALTKACGDRLIALLHAMPNGVIRMSDDVKGVVETSLNVGVVSMDADKAEIRCLIRSLIDSGKLQVEGMLHALGRLAGATTVAKGSYPGWKPDANSPVMHVVRDTYRQLFNKTPNIQVIHAGLECGLFKKPYPDMDMVSIGPTITGPHSPDEQVHIASVGQYWTLLTALLKAIPVKA
ncbi:beta-Ala-His dipeptidase [Sodalis endosymbiont of Spalangia cameroni]|uniref:beta-Ala-His dipeptidase n=1 Tax=Sodalis praecaptivus TaxID=1239307 RepID=UPI0031F782B4